MGKKIAQYPKRRPKYRIYDTKPGSVGRRSFYITGFPDGCARQFTAALAMFGSPALHELMRYGPGGDALPYAKTDAAYDKIKRRVCNVGKRRPCGASISKLERGTAFVSIYERYEVNSRWAEVLLHDGAVLASDIKSNR